MRLLLRRASSKWKKVDGGARKNPGLVFKVCGGGMDALLVDLKVAIWCVKIYCAEAFGARIAKPTMGEGGFRRDSIGE
jgi:hypothetical protein